MTTLDTSSPIVWKTVQSPWVSLLSFVVTVATLVAWLVGYVGISALVPFATVVSSMLLGAHITAVRFNHWEPYRRWWRSGVAAARRVAGQRRSPEWSELFATPLVSSPRAESSYFNVVDVKPFRVASIRELKVELTNLDGGQPSVASNVRDAVMHSLAELRLVEKLDHGLLGSLPAMSYLRLAVAKEGGLALSIGSARPKEDRFRAVLDRDRGVELVFGEHPEKPGVVDRVAYTTYGLGGLAVPAFMKVSGR